jgi:polyphosphate glucokinase
MDILGIDIGGSGIKGAIVDVTEGVLKTERYRVPTPNPCTREALIDSIRQIVEHFAWKDSIGCGYPGVIRRNVICSAANLDDSLIGLDLAEAVKNTTGCALTVVNDADAAGLAEIASGNGKDVKGSVMLVTVGTGIGTALFVDGKLVPNTELGHLQFNGNDDIEKVISEAARKDLGLSWKKWTKQLNAYLNYLNAMLDLELIILGGGGVKKMDKFEEYLKIDCPYKWAKHGNLAGIIGAAAAGVPE